MRYPILFVVVVSALGIAACGSETPKASSPAATAAAEAAAGVRVVSPVAAQDLLADGTRTLIDVRTPEEFAEGHLPGAELIDFNAPDFAERIGALDRNTQYVIYCRSGNRSSQARALFTSLGFTDVADIDGGILAWTEAGLPVSPAG